MSEESATPDLVELTRRIADATSARDFDALIGLCTHDAVFDMAPPAVVATWPDELIERATGYSEIDEARVVAERLAEERG
jgi:hypothetical protein